MEIFLWVAFPSGTHCPQDPGASADLTGQLEDSPNPASGPDSAGPLHTSASVSPRELPLLPAQHTVSLLLMPALPHLRSASPLLFLTPRLRAWNLDWESSATRGSWEGVMRALPLLTCRNVPPVPEGVRAAHDPRGYPGRQPQSTFVPLLK